VKIDVFIMETVKGHFDLKIDNVKTAVKTVVNNENKPVKGNINVIFCDNEKIVELNKQFFNKDRPTDVIAFSYDEDEPDEVTGEIYISVDQALLQFSDFNSTLHDELMRLVIHGALHLCGYEDSGKELKKVMTKKENYYLKSTVTD